ncbi:MAG: ribonuclease R family protein, partial [Bacilli bacterium]
DLTITIDGADAKDLDDAISLTINENNHYVLKVSIADVSYYVKEKSALNNDAYQRGTSLYLADRVVPMLPHQLSNGMCSLLPDVIRLCLTCEMEFDKQGKMLNHKIYESYIKSDYRLTYDEVFALYDEDILFTNNDLNKMLLDMKSLSLLLQKQKTDRGLLNFNIEEPKLILNRKGEVIDIVVRERNSAHLLIEDFMIVANECVATHVKKMKLPFIYRIHEQPSTEKLLDFSNTLKIFDPSYIFDYNDKSNKNLAQTLTHIATTPYQFLDRLLLRTMAKAVYDTKTINHYGLASPCYTHFTSPIRRYPDLIVHRLLKKYIVKGETNQNNDELTLKLDKIAQHSSKKERDAIEAEREVNDMKKAMYMSKYINQSFKGQIISVTSFGFFVELENTIEGLIHISTLKPGYFTYHKEGQAMIAQNNKTKYTLGDYVNIKPVRVNLETYEVDFELV